MKIVLLLNSVGSLFCTYTVSIHSVHYAWMNGYSTLLHNIAPGKYIIIKVEIGLQLHAKYRTNQIEKTTTKIIIKMLMILDFKILSM